MSVLIACAIVLTVKSIRSYASLREVAWSARLFTAKLSNFPLRITDVDRLQAYFDEGYPGQVLQCYICFDLNKLKKYYKTLRKVEDKIQHYEVLWTTVGERPLIHKNPILRVLGCNALCKPGVDALEYYHAKKERYEQKIRDYHHRERQQITTGVCFATFYKADECRQFIRDFEDRKNVPETSLDKQLEVRFLSIDWLSHTHTFSFASPFARGCRVLTWRPDLLLAGAAGTTVRRHSLGFAARAHSGVPCAVYRCECLGGDWVVLLHDSHRHAGRH